MPSEAAKEMNKELQYDENSFYPKDNTLHVVSVGIDEQNSS